MSTVAIIGAGPGLGLAVAQKFGQSGFSIALISRTQHHLDSLTATLKERDITARGYAADARNPEQLRDALTQAASELGEIQVLQYSPVPAGDFMKPVLETSAADLLGPIEQSVYGPVTAINHVLPAMRERGAGTILLINGSSSVRPNGNVTATSIAFAAESAYGQMLHDALAPEGIHVAQLIIPHAIGASEPDHEPAALAETIFGLYQNPSEFRTFVGGNAL